MFKKTLVDLHAKIELPVPSWVYRLKDMEEQVKWLEDEAKDLQSFLKDHRSRDHYNIEIVREYKLLCSFCDREEERAFDGCPCCCNKAVEEWESLKTEDKNG